jgi:putative PIN family toxin of toxin-antitoxin system
MNIILDSNINIAAFAGRGLCNSLFEFYLDRYSILLSEFILSELSNNFLKKLKLPDERIKSLIEYLREFCVIWEYEKLKKNVCRDKDDDEIRALAKAFQAKYIISGDKDLLVLKKFGSTTIVSPREFWNIAKNK